ncbi:helix-turn-helix domain-containing protein [Paracoccus sediminilitoris]|uniref:helix-turn-helix domain-containing protein n=1 Tax=Paracoccus sediminilitoris TaxID=2202419 RepID=UPI003FA71A76
MADPELFKLPDAASLLGLSRASLYKMAEKGEAEFVRLGGRTLMRRAEIERLAATAPTWRPDPARSAPANAARRKRPAPTRNGG